MVIRDRRRIDPDTLQPRVPLPDHPTTGGVATPGQDQPQAALAERTADLQRLKAEYDNYRRRVSREREHAQQTAVAQVVSALLPVLDTLDEARARADLAGFETAAQELTERLGNLGLRRFGTVGDAFDPSVHDAVASTREAGVEHPACSQVLRPGYRLGDHLLRPATVAVTQPTTTPTTGTAAASGDGAPKDLGEGGPP
jgi:molecular chaperone GrpE